MRNAEFRRFFPPAIALIAIVAGGAAAQAAEGKPAHKDSRFRPKEVTFTTAVEPAEAAPGETVTYKVTASVDRPWHIYAQADAQPEEGPRNTVFDVFDAAGLKPAGKWKASREPVQKHEAAFPDIKFLRFHEGEVTWSLPLKVPADAKPGKKTVRAQANFQICDDKSCKPPTFVTLPAATLTVTPRKTSAAIVGALTVGLIEAPAAKAAEPAPAARAGAKEKAAAGSVDEAIDRGLVPFLLFAAGGGLLALLMPCVWPMVPVTVNFFVKQGHASKGKTTGLAITYCLAIIGIFTLVGVLFSAVLGASSLTRLANNPWLNLAVAGIFIAFGLSLLGLFEIGLPSFLLNASARGESRGGLIGVVFMALTLTITSFTCTFPVVGGLLVLASRGNYLYPVLGLLTFATVLALPFFLMAMAPGLMSRLPRSGDWMNAVKVVGGLVEIGAAFKFLNTAEIGLGSTPENAWFDSPVVLTAWVILSLICGLYLLGLFKTDHDQDDVKVGAGRLMAGALFLGLALYLTPALFGYPPQGQVYNRLVVGLLPADSDRLDRNRFLPAPAGAAEGSAGSRQVADAPRPVHATSPKPEEAIRQERTVHGVAWGMSLDAALEKAKAENRPVLIDFTGVNCANCRQMERAVMPRPDVVPLLKQFVPVQLFTDFVPIDSIKQAQREELAEDNLAREIDLINENTSPVYVVLSPEGKVLSRVGGYNEPPVFIKFLSDALAKHEGGKQVARADAPAGE